MERPTSSATPATGDLTSPPANANEAANGTAAKRWKVDQAEPTTPVIRANVISLRVSYQGRVQIAFFDEAQRGRKAANPAKVRRSSRPIP